jgi:uncharacterized ferredoxin-like protein
MDTARLMMVAARTAPKSGGKDDIETLLIYGEEKEKIVAEMERIGEERNIPGFHRDAKNVKDSDVVILIGVNSAKSFGLNCGACGHSTCNEFNEAARNEGLDFEGPSCLFKIIDLGIALGSAAKTAGLHNADNRIMYRISTAAQRLGLLEKSTVSMGIPLSAKGKSIYFDRKT